MNQKLTNEIIRHVYNCLGIKLPSIKHQRHSLTQDKYLLTRKISFEDGESKNVWGVTFEVEKDSHFQIAVADLSDGGIPEYAMICSLTDSPMYGTYLTYEEFSDPSEDVLIDRPIIACNLKKSPWSECNVYMQAAFLCGMEKIKEITSPFSKIEDESIVDSLVQFIEFYQDKMEIDNARKED